MPDRYPVSAEIHRLTIPADHAGQRLDQALAELLPEYSRTRIKDWIAAGRVLLNGNAPRPRDIVAGGEQVSVEAVAPKETTVEAEAIQLDVVHEDKQVLVINKKPGLVVHPGAGNPRGTLQNALLHFDPKLAALPRSGIVHRIDKDTSGLLVIARTEEAHAALTAMIEAHDVDRHYEAVCVGVMTAGGTLDAPIGRHPVDRLRMAVREDGREAITHYRVVQRFRAHTHVRLQLETGRTHQIRVHLTHAGYPLVGDRVYGRRLLVPRGADQALIEILRGFNRQALHAARLEFAHPKTQKPLLCEAPLPQDMQRLIAALADDLSSTQSAAGRR